MLMGMPTVLAERDDRILTLVFNRPERLNAVTEQLYRELLEHLRIADADPDIRVVILTGSGRAFCVGADLQEHAEGARGPAERAEYIELAWRVCEQIQRMGTPVVAAVHGYAFGAGAEMAISADFLIAAEDAVLGFPEAAIGTYVGGGVTRRLPRLVGLRRATELLLLGARFTGAQAFEWGLAHEAVQAEKLSTATGDLAHVLTTRAPISLAKLKAALLQEDSMEEVFRAEARDLFEVMGTEDWAEGVAAFGERRTPIFHGK